MWMGCHAVMRVVNLTICSRPSVFPAQDIRWTISKVVLCWLLSVSFQIWDFQTSNEAYWVLSRCQFPYLEHNHLHDKRRRTDLKGDWISNGRKLRIEFSLHCQWHWLSMLLKSFRKWQNFIAGTQDVTIIFAASGKTPPWGPWKPAPHTMR